MDTVVMGIYRFKPEDAEDFAHAIGARTRLVGDELRFAECPYCHGVRKARGQDKDTFAINMTTGMFKCMRSGCGAKGNMLTLSKDFGFSLGRDVDEYYNGGARYRRLKQNKPLPKPEAVVYMESRGISKEVAEKYNITAKNGDSDILVFPFYDENDNLTFVKYRKMNFDPEKDSNKEWCEKDCKPILFGMNHCNPENNTLVLTEGQIDSLSVVEAGIENAVSVPTGMNGFSWVPHCWDFMGKYSTLIVFGDHEKGRITLLSEMQIRFHGVVKHVREEDYKECKDANELLQKYGRQAVIDAVNNAVIVENPKIIRVADIKRKKADEMTSISSGFSEIDRKLGGFYLGQLVILTGKRGQGKSTLGSQFGIQAISEGQSVMFYSGELNDWMFKEWFERQVAGRKNINAIQGGKSTTYSVSGAVIGQMEKWYGDKAFFYDNSIYRNDDSDTEEESLIKTLETAITQYGCTVIFIDNLMTAIEDDLGSDIYRQQTLFVKQLAIMAKKYEALIFLIVHPKKNNESSTDCDTVMGSSNITNLADVVLSYGEPKKDQMGDRVLQIWKNRLNGKLDREGIPLWYEEASKRITAVMGQYDWTYGWESFETLTEDDELPFGDMEE